MTHNSRIPKFYHLIKTHKEEAEVKVRPIVSNCSGPTRKIAWLLQKLLCPLLKTVPTHLQSSAQLMYDISKIDRESLVEQSYPFSLDVNALYTSIPISDAIKTVCDYISEQKEIHIPLHLNYVKDLLEVTLRNTYFIFNDIIYQQIHGLPMGSSISGTLAIIFMYKLEIAAIRSMPMALYRRYADDICIITTNREEAIRIKEFMDRQHPNIKFDIEHPVNDRTLRLLDFEFTITSDGSSVFNFYKKKAKKPLFMHHRSALPDRMKMDVIRNEVKRIETRCSNPDDAARNLKEFHRILCENGYPETSISTSMRKPKRKKDKPKNSMDLIYLRLPFISDGADAKIKRIIKKYDLPVRIYHKPRTLRQMLQPKTTTPECQLRNCPLNEPMKCQVQKCVYEVQCQNCHQKYIGSTVRPLHTRIKEHLRSTNSSVYKHKTVCSSDFSTEIIGRAGDQTSLRILEAIKIKERKPTLNSRQERDELADLVF